MKPLVGVSDASVPLVSIPITWKCLLISVKLNAKMHRLVGQTDVKINDSPLPLST